MTVNKAILIGNLGRDPEFIQTRHGSEFCTLSLATSESWKDKNTGERVEKTDWHRIVIFSEGLVNVARNYLSKGEKVYIEGKIQTRKYEKDGEDRYTTEIVLSGFDGTLKMLGAAKNKPKKESHDGFAGQDRYSPDLDDEIPF